MQKDKVFLVGFMGAGKSTVGPLLAKKLGWQFVDLDEKIEESCRLSVRKIFEHHGEEHFRELETRALLDMRTLCQCVVALGGGAFCRRENQVLVKEMGWSVYLDCPFDIILERCPIDGHRPLFGDVAEARELYEKRLPSYRTTDFRVDTSRMSPANVVDIIIQHAESFAIVQKQTSQSD